MVTLSRSTGTGGTFSFNNTNTTGNYELLLDDGHDVGGVGASVTYTLSGLAAGTYTVYTYAVAPDNNTFITNVTVTGSVSMSPQAVGGAIPVNAFLAGVTHSVHVVDVLPGASLSIDCSTLSGFGTVNGIQVCSDFGLTLSQPGGAGSPLIIQNSCGDPGSLYYNLATFVMGSFPVGPMYGLEMSIVEALALIGAGPPFSGTLDVNGQALFGVPGLPPGITIYFVSGMERNGALVVTPAASYTTL